MVSENYIKSDSIQDALDILGFRMNADEGRLMLAELILKASAGYYNSHTEESFLGWFDVLRKSRIPNKRGREFIMSVFYNHSNRRSESFELMKLYRV